MSTRSVLRRASDQNHYGDLGARRKFQEAGFDRHLVKPIGRATLEELAKVRNLAPTSKAEFMLT